MVHTSHGNETSAADKQSANEEGVALWLAYLKTPEFSPEEDAANDALIEWQTQAGREQDLAAMRVARRRLEEGL